MIVDIIHICSLCKILFVSDLVLLHYSIVFAALQVNCHVTYIPCLHDEAKMKQT